MTRVPQSYFVAGLVTLIVGYFVITLGKSRPVLNKNRIGVRSFSPRLIGVSGIFASCMGGILAFVGVLPNRHSPLFSPLIEQAVACRSRWLGMERFIAVMFIGMTLAGLWWDSRRLWQSPREEYNRTTKISFGFCITIFSGLGGLLITAALALKGHGSLSVILGVLILGFTAECIKSVVYSVVDYYFF